MTCVSSAGLRLNNDHEQVALCWVLRWKSWPSSHQAWSSPSSSDPALQGHRALLPQGMCWRRGGWLLILRSWSICLANHARKTRRVTPGIVFGADQNVSVQKLGFWSLLHRMSTFNNEVNEVSGSWGQFSQFMKIFQLESSSCAYFFSPVHLYNLINSDQRSLIPTSVTSS